jgi:hypothetical protein
MLFFMEKMSYIRLNVFKSDIKQVTSCQRRLRGIQRVFTRIEQVFKITEQVIPRNELVVTVVKRVFKRVEQMCFTRAQQALS